MARFIEGGIWIGAVNIDIQTSMFVLEKKFFRYCNFFLHFIQNRSLSDFHTLGKLLKPTYDQTLSRDFLITSTRCKLPNTQNGISRVLVVNIEF